MNTVIEWMDQGARILYRGKELGFQCEPSLLHGISFQDQGRKLMNIPEILLMILKYLDTRDLAVFSSTCVRWHNLATPLLYQHVCFHGIPDQGNCMKFVQAVNRKRASNNISQGIINQASLFVKAIFTKGMSTAIQNTLSAATRSRSHLPRPHCNNPACQKLREIADMSKPKTLLIPNKLGTYSHRFQGAVYALVSPDSMTKVKEHYPCNEKPPCLQVTRKTKSKWSTMKSKLYDTHGPFLNSFSCQDMLIGDETLANILESTKNLSTLKVKQCIFVGDQTVVSVSSASTQNLTTVILSGLPLLTDTALHYLARNSPNLEFLDLTDSYRITESGVRDILVLCPFIKTLIVNRFGDGESINDKVIAYITSYGISLRFVGLAGCNISSAEIPKMIEKSKVQHWQFGFKQLGTRRLNRIKQVVEEWMQCKSVINFNQEFSSVVNNAIEFRFPNKKRISIVCKETESIDRILLQDNM